MKLKLTAGCLLLSFICSSALAQLDGPCLAIYRTNKAFISSALEESEKIYVNRVELKRSGSKGVVTISSDDTVEKFNVEQQCNGSVKAELVESQAVFVCKEVIDCMPNAPDRDAKYCSQRYVEWTSENCDKEVIIIH